MHEAKDGDKQVEQEEGAKEDMPLAFIDQPDADFLAETEGGSGFLYSVCVATLESLESDSLRLITL